MPTMDSSEVVERHSPGSTHLRRTITTHTHGASSRAPPHLVRSSGSIAKEAGPNRFSSSAIYAAKTPV